MAVGSRLVSDVLRIMRRVITRQNANDPDSNDSNLISYINDFVSLKMPNNARFFEEFGTLSFTIDETVTDGVYTFNDVGATSDFMSISNEALISVSAPLGSSLSWNPLQVTRDPGRFFDYWGINNEDILTKGFPTEVLFYGNELTFRTIADKGYLVKMYGYKKNNDYADENVEIQFDWWLRYLAYGAALDYVMDYNYDDGKIAKVEKGFKIERRHMLTYTHNQIKNSRSLPRF
jgi:hypothetical protein|tara:strand:- start:9615 stop:10313 length:699 start_codon:yes stop_codon:yes gene_type:complete